MANNEEDFLAFITVHGHALRGLAHLLAGNEHDAADLYQETLIKMYGSWNRIRESGAVLGYARTVMSRHYISAQRRPWVKRAILATPPERPTTARSTHDVDAFDTMRTALGTLSGQQRAVIVLRFYCDLTEADIAQHLQCSAGTVKTHTARALTRLRADTTLASTFRSGDE